MDRRPGFENHAPLSSGGFNKPQPIQSDGVGMKPMGPSILDRFRGMVKEREEELKVFGDGIILPLSTDEVVRIYETLLSELTINSKPIITDLTIIAGELRAHGDGIADAICARIIEVPVDQKLPSLYLLDSIVKNIGKEYIKHFASRLPEVFCEAYAQVHPNMHRAMRHLFGTWSTVFPLSVLQSIEVQLQFGPSGNVQSSVLSSSRASESPRPTHGIHINPKYLEAQQRQFGHSTTNAVVTEVLSSTSRVGLTTSGHDAVKRPLSSLDTRIAGPSSPYRMGHVGSLSTPLNDDFGIDSSPKRVSIRPSPTRPGIGLSRVMGREEESSDWWSRRSSNQLPKPPGAYKYGNGVDLSGPRALISAYGVDEREKNLNHSVQLEPKGAEQKLPIRTWQNTEEEEFDWEDMNPALADRKQPHETYSSFPPPVIPRARHNFAASNANPLVTDHRGNSSKSGPGSLNSIGGVLPNITGTNDLSSRIPPTFSRESFMPHQQSHIQPNAKTDVKFGGHSRLSSTYDTPASDLRSADDASMANDRYPADFQNPHILSSVSSLPSQMQTRGQLGMQNAANASIDQNLNKTLHAEQHFVNPGSMSQVLFPHIPNHQRPGMMHLNLQSPAQPSQVQPNFLMTQGARHNLPLPILGAPNMPFNLLPNAQSSMPIHGAPNIPFNVTGPALHSLPRPPLPGTNQVLPTGQNIGQVAPSTPAGGPFSGLIGSLVAQGLISVSKQDPVGVEFDQDSLKVRHESTITALYDDLPRQCKSCGLRFRTQEEHSKHMDWHVNKNRTLKSRKSKPSPKWFVSVSMWLSGAEALGNEAVPGFSPAEDTVEKKDDEELSVPADEDQNTCALCGEPFEDFYSDEMEEWMYKGAVYMYAPAGGSTADMDRSQLGPIVHAKCRSDSHGPSQDLENDDGESTEESPRKRLRC